MAKLKKVIGKSYKKESPANNFHIIGLNKMEEWVLRNCPIIAREIGLEDIRFAVMSDKTSEEPSPHNEDTTPVFRIGYDSIYKSAYITIHKTAYRMYESNQLELLTGMIVHEVCHIVTDRVVDLSMTRYVSGRSIIEKAAEELTESVSRIARKVLPTVLK